MNRRHLPLLIAVLALAGTTPAQASPELVAKILEESAARPKATAYLDHLVNRIGPRLTSSDNLIAAVHWARDEFAAMGITNARVEEWGTFPVGFNRGPWFGRVTAPEAFAIDFNTHAWSAGTRGPTKGLIRKCPRNEEELQTLTDEQVAGTWFIDPPRGGSRQVRDDLMRRGAHGFLHGGRELLITDGNSRVDFDALPTVPDVYLHPESYQRVKKLLADEQEVRVEIDIRNHFKRGPIPLHNVIAEITGTEFPDQYVIVGGHIDSWDGATGTTDNGTGVATTMEAARLLMAAGARPRRTIRFMLWSGEEQGLLGSKAFLEQHLDELPRISAVLVHDGGTNYVSGISGVPEMIPTLERVFAPVLELSEEMPFKVRTIRAFAPIGSDHDSYCAKGVPGFFWNQAGRANYTRTHHTQFDTFDAAVEAYQIHSSQVIAIGALGLANEDELLTREGFSYRGFGRQPPPPRQGPDRTLGITVGETPTITGVLDDSIASRAGLRSGDTIVKIGTDEIADSEEIGRALRNGPAKTEIVVLRGGEKVTVTVEFPK